MKEKALTIFRRRNIGFIFQAFNLIPELTQTLLSDELQMTILS
mgnify:CR=1 FL=1